MSLPAHIAALVLRNALFVVNHSAGKDSQAMLIALRAWGIPDRQLLLVHADLGEVEWAGNVEHIKANSFGLPLVVAKPVRGLLQMIEERGMFPSPQQRQCTSDLKRGPIDREVRRYLAQHPEHNGLVVSCMGIRAAESASRAKAKTWKLNSRNSVAGRTWFDWLPIHDMSTQAVWETIKRAGQTPHPVYAQGMTRLSCCFCIMASKGDLTTAAKLNPALYSKYVALERKIGRTMSMSRQSLEEITGVAAQFA